MHTPDPEPARVAEMVTRLDAAATAPLNAYWVSLAGDRNAFADRLKPLLTDRGIGVLIVRSAGFTNANALMGDLRDLLEENRSAFLGILARPRPDPNRIGVVLLARKELAIGQGASPVIWPDWVPVVGNREVICYITDLTQHVEASLDAGEIDVPRLGRALFAVEEALVRRLLVVHGLRPVGQQQFFERIRRRSDPAWFGFLKAAEAELRRVPTIESFRPDVRGGRSVVSRVWGLAQVSSPRELVAAEADLAAALDLTVDVTSVQPWEGLMAVLSCQPPGGSSAVGTLCRSILLTVPAVCQFLTCAAHADRYQRFPVNLLISVVGDLHRALVEIEVFLIHLSDEPIAVGGPPLLEEDDEPR